MMKFIFVFSSFVLVSNAFAKSLLLEESMRQIKAMKSSTYQHKTNVDEAKGVYRYDCSGFLDYSLKRVSNSSYKDILISPTGEVRPVARDFYNLLKSKKVSQHWKEVLQAFDLLPGDIIVWVHSDTKTNSSGHVVVVAEAPIVNSENKKEVFVRVIDSALSGHGSDSRPDGKNGLGIGMMAFALNDKNELVGYRWNAYKSKKMFTEPIAMGRLLEN